MKKIPLLVVLGVSLISLSGCFTGDYPHDEPSATCPDNHKSGSGTYGGTVSALGSTEQQATDSTK